MASAEPHRQELAAGEGGPTLRTFTIAPGWHRPQLPQLSFGSPRITTSGLQVHREPLINTPHHQE